MTQGVLLPGNRRRPDYGCSENFLAKNVWLYSAVSEAREREFVSALARGGAPIAAAAAAAGIYYESTTIIVLATLMAAASVIGWVRWSAPHDHWRALRRRRPSDP
jgi:hypothetical protein